MHLIISRPEMNLAAGVQFIKLIWMRKILPLYFIPVILVVRDGYSSVENKVKWLPPLVVNFKKSC